MCKTIKISYQDSDEDASRMAAIADILSEGVYSYLRTEGLLSGNGEQTKQIKEVMDRVKQILTSGREEKNENNT